MAMVGEVSLAACTGGLTAYKSSGLVLVRRPLGAILDSSNEPGELSQWLCHDDSTLNIHHRLLRQKAAKYNIRTQTTRQHCLGIIIIYLTFINLPRPATAATATATATTTTATA